MKAIPITIIGGFLGAGKTSLLSHILAVCQDRRMAVLVNDFGQLNIDAELVVSIEGETVSLTNGCICCTIRDDLMTEVLRLLAQKNPPEHIIIETSGVSDPTLVAHTFQMPAMNGLVEVDSIISVVDADQALKLDEAFHDLARRQIKIADLIIINKIDLSPPEQQERLRAHVEKINPNARIIKTIGGRAPINLLIGTAGFDSQQFPVKQGGHKLEFQTWTYTNQKPFTFMAIRKAIEAMPSSIYRAKGFIQLEGAPEEQGVFQMTGGRSWLRLGQHWKNSAKQTRLVFIGKQFQIDVEKVKEHFDQCQSDYSREAMDNRAEPVMVENLRALTLMFG